MNRCATGIGYRVSGIAKRDKNRLVIARAQPVAIYDFLNNET